MDPAPDSSSKSNFPSYYTQLLYIMRGDRKKKLAGFKQGHSPWNKGLKFDTSCHVHTKPKRPIIRLTVDEFQVTSRPTADGSELSESVMLLRPSASATSTTMKRDDKKSCSGMRIVDSEEMSGAFNEAYGIHRQEANSSIDLPAREVNSSHGKPTILAPRNYTTLSAVKAKSGCPERVRGDAGTENTHVKQFQIFFRGQDVDRYSGLHSYISGTSTAINESNGLLRKEVTEFWMNMFKTLQNDGYYAGDFVDKNLVQFCFMELIQSDIDSCAKTWNCHRIRPSKNSTMPHGRPAMMYAMPELHGATDLIKPVNQALIGICETEIIQKSNIVCDPTVHELATLLMEEMSCAHSSDPYDMCDLYIHLREEIKKHALI